jgi:nitroreductase
MFDHPEFDLFEAIYTTRSMRRLKTDPVPRDVIERIIEAATMGPSGSNRQPWVFLVVTERDDKEFIAHRYQQAWEKYLTSAARKILESEPDSQQGRILRSARYLANHLADAPVLLFACVKRYTDAARRGEPMYGSIFPAIQNLCLAARSYGLGTSITGLHRMFGNEIDARLGVPAEYANIALIPIGYPQGRWGRPDRKAAKEITFWNRWGRSAK